MEAAAAKMRGRIRRTEFPGNVVMDRVCDEADPWTIAIIIQKCGHSVILLCAEPIPRQMWYWIPLLEEA